MTAFSFTLGLSQRPATTRAWHLCTVIIPRRTITGRLVCGKVWRRHDGRHWLYKKFSLRTGKWAGPGCLNRISASISGARPSRCPRYARHHSCIWRLCVLTSSKKF